ncbi:hypothetical protein HPB50_004490 [Hyalomma asiaticum]|uniref:Uncharacterized protein n=1 Tax=Hyalomma asiaticum TaxID=266040 RepID=A0ACB7RJ07_HYAAI|nr:hypothetical protein HPB50_004490 [Hyalomma asiaticum]
MSGSDYTLTGFGDFWERRVVTFLHPLPSILLCRVEALEGEGCPFRDGDCIKEDVIPLHRSLRHLERFTVLCRSGCDFIGTMSQLREHLVESCSDELTCLKYCQNVGVNSAVAQRQHSPGTVQPAQTVKALDVAGAVLIQELSRVWKDFEDLLQKIASGEVDKEYLATKGNSIAEQLALIEVKWEDVPRHPELTGGVGVESSTTLQLAATPHRAPSRPNAFIHLCSFPNVYRKLRPVDKDNGGIDHLSFVLGGYCFDIGCVVETYKGDPSIYFELRLQSGPWDDRLSWPFNRGVSVILSHPTESERDIVLPVLLGYEMSKKPAPGTSNEPDYTEPVLWKEIEPLGFVDNGTLYANVELA